MQNDLNKSWNYFRLIIQKLLEDSLSLEEIHFLREIILTNEKARRYYIDSMIVYSNLCQISGEISNEIGNQSVDSLNKALLDLSKYEKSAPAVNIHKRKTPVELITDVRNRKAMLNHGRRTIPIYLWISLTSLAAMMLLMAYVYFNPRTSYDVATIADVIHAQWSSSLPVQKGVRLSASSEQIELRRGFVKIETDKGVRIVLEAPAEFRFISPEEIILYYGRLSVFVPESGSGFSVQANNSKIIDLGTKFGVYAEMSGDTELHLFKGRTLLIAGRGIGARQTAEISGGRAVRINHTGQSIKDVPLRNDLFAREIDSQTGLVWYGQNQINLADVVGGGNGFGTGTLNVGIDTVNGTFRKTESKSRTHSNVYTPVQSNVFVDGVFIPNGSGEQVVSSAGHIFAECPPTTGYFYTDISNTPMIVGKAGETDMHSLYLNQTNYSLKDNPSIFLHSNTGITFDLNQYRSRLPEANIERFQSEIGISNSAPKVYIADFWILVDGQVRYHNPEPMHRGEVVTIDIEINKQDRFLTLIVTDGSVHDIWQDEHAIGSDWGVFGKPYLILK